MYIQYKSATSSMPHAYHMHGVLCPHAGVQVITHMYMCTHACGLYTCSIPSNRHVCQPSNNHITNGCVMQMQ